MLYEFAITPEIFDKEFLEPNRENQIILMELLRGVLDNGMVANLQNGRLRPEILQRANKLDARVRTNIVKHLNLISSRRRFVTHATSGRVEVSNPLTNGDWLRVALDSHEQHPLYGIIASDQLITESELSSRDKSMMRFSQVLDSHQWSDRKQRTWSWALRQNEEDYRKALTPILRHAQTLVLIDPYIQTKEQFLRTVGMCLQLLKHSGDVEIRIHAKVPDLDEKLGEARKNRSGQDEKYFAHECLNGWESELRDRGWVTSNRKFVVTLWRKKDSGERFHDRYILTDQCGVSVPGGLDCFDKANNTVWSLLSHDTLLRCEKEFSRGDSPYEFLDKREIK